MIYNSARIKLIKYREDALREGLRGFFFASRIPHTINGIVNHAGDSKTISMIRESDGKIVNKNLSRTKKDKFGFHTLYAVTSDHKLFNPGDLVFYTTTKKVKKLSEGLMYLIGENIDSKYWKLIAPLAYEDWDKALHGGILFGKNLCDITIKGKNAYITNVISSSEAVILPTDTKSDVLRYMKKHATGNISIISTARIANGLGVGESIAIKHVKQLIKDGTIIMEKNLGSRGSQYRISPLLINTSEPCQNVISDKVI